MEWMPKVGDRVEYSERGLQALNPRNGQRRGTCVGKSHAAGSVAVIWDGLKHRKSFEVQFLAPSQNGPIEPGLSPVHQRMIDLCKAGKSAQEIADEIGRVPSAIHHVLRKAGLIAARPKPWGIKKQVWPQGQCDELRKRWDLGYTCAEIAAALNVSRNAVIGKAHRMNLAPRRSPTLRDRA